MVAPLTTIRGVPAGIKLIDPHPTKISFENDLTLPLWEKNVTPPGYSGGPAIPIGDMHSVTWVSKIGQALKDMTDASALVAYAPDLEGTIVAQININQSITIEYADGRGVSFWGILREFTKDEIQMSQQGVQPTGRITITPTNYDHVNGTEEDPVWF